MSDHGPSDVDAATVRALRDRVADGDVSWLRGEHRAGRLGWLADHLAPGDVEQLGNRLERGDVAWVRRVLGDVQVRQKRTARPVAAVAPVTLPPPRPAGGSRAGWLVRTGVAVTVVALATLGLSQCRDGRRTTATTTTVAAPATSPPPTTPAPQTATTAVSPGTGPAASVGAVTTTAGTTASPTTAPPSPTVPRSPVAPTPAPTTTTLAPTQDLVDTAVTAGAATLGRALAAAELTTTLRGTGPFTVLAPSEAAWAKLPAGTLDALLRDRAALTRALRYHVLDGRVTAGQLTPGAVRTLEGGTVTVAFTGGRLTINDATVVRTDVGATNGLVHVVDTVLLPRDFTVGGRAVVAAPPPAGDVVQVAEADGRFGVLRQALDAAGLTATLRGPGPYTVFAPTDAAFRALPPALLERLLADRATLAKILTYHVVAGRLGTTQLQPGTVPTVEGDTVVVATAAALTIDGATVLSADVAATNGVVHVVDRVLVPADVDLASLGVPIVAPAPITLSVFFDSDSATIRADAAAALVALAARIPAGAKVALVGVSDPRGNAEANLKLSDDRARAVQRALEAAGLKATFAISAKGSEPNTDLQQSRRVDITAT